MVSSNMKDLFSQFTPVTAKAWRNQLEKDLKGVPLSDLEWKNENGFVVQPFYTAEDLKASYSPAFTHCEWKMMVKDGDQNDAGLNTSFLTSLNAGADAIQLNLEKRNLTTVLNGIRLDFIHSVFQGNTSDLQNLGNYLNTHYPNLKLNVTLLPAACKDSSELKKWADAASAVIQKPVAGADVLYWHNQHCGAALEIALAFALLAEYAEYTDLSGSVTIRTGVSADYFVEMAKLRAMRRLWDVFQKEWKSKEELWIIAETSLSNKTISDRYNNLLRTTVEAMAAISGGCNALVVNDYDVLKGESDALAQRMAINQQHILKEESYFDKTADSACGSYYMEHLTDQLAEKALELFKEMQEHGGYFASLGKGWITEKVSSIAQKNRAAFDNNEILITGVNKYRNEKENLKMSEERLNFLRALQIENPALQFELQNFFK